MMKPVSVLTWILVLLLTGCVWAGEGVAVVIGIDDYGADGKLATPGNDAKAVAATLTRHAGYAAGRTLLMTADAKRPADRPTRANITRNIERAVKDARADDQLLVYFSGRARAEKNDLLLIGLDGDAKNTVSLRALRETLSKSTVRWKVVIVDVADRPNDAGDVDKAAVDVLTGAKDVVLLLTTGAVAQVTGPRSAFSVAVCEALAGKADANADNIVTVSELHGYLQKRLAELTRKPRKPRTMNVLDRRHLFRYIELTFHNVVEPVDPFAEKVTAQEAFSRGWKAKDHYEKIRWYTRSIELRPNYATAYNNRAVSYLCTNENDLAWKDLNKCLELNPRHSYALSTRGKTYMGKGEYEKALVDLNKSIEVAPSFGYPYNYRGMVYHRQGKLHLALKDYTRAIELKHKVAEVHVRRAKVYLRLEDYDKAWADVKQCREAGGKVPREFIRDLEHASGRFDEDENENEDEDE